MCIRDSSRSSMSSSRSSPSLNHVSVQIAMLASISLKQSIKEFIFGQRDREFVVRTVNKSFFFITDSCIPLFSKRLSSSEWSGSSSSLPDLSYGRGWEFAPEAGVPLPIPEKKSAMPLESSSAGPEGAEKDLDILAAIASAGLTLLHVCLLYTSPSPRD